ncbi:hypothetical protein [Rhizobium sp. Pop5]|uniref:hypothetical protein n=1 Tax=Rhizobium sp. Pop5 TaxID=1223565 RepID=UPI000FFC1523|nr:hypothetical protein [Rhizobium sp. Pop5]
MPDHLAMELRRHRLDEFRSDPIAKVGRAPCPVVCHSAEDVRSFKGQRDLHAPAIVVREGVLEGV